MASVTYEEYERSLKVFDWELEKKCLAMRLQAQTSSGVSQPMPAAATTAPVAPVSPQPASIWAAARADEQAARAVTATDTSKAVWAAARAMQGEVAKAATPPSTVSIWDSARAQNG